MKTKTLFLVAIVMVLSSCIVKSLHPFYTKDTIRFEQKFIGVWEDKEKGVWDVKSFKDEFLKDAKKSSESEVKPEDLEVFNKYKDGYIINYTKNSKESLFLGIPFKIKNQLFIDFTPLELGSNLNNLVQAHLVGTHSLVKFDIVDAKNISIKWFDEDRIKHLFKEKKIKIRHEKVGIDESFLLTASSEELQKFVKKYMAIDTKEKWETSVKFNLKKIDATP